MKILAIVLVLASTSAFADDAKPKPPPPCNPAPEIQKGNDALAADQNAAALAHYETAFACKADSALYPRLVLASCKIKDAKKAQLYYARCGNSCRVMASRCLTYNIDLDAAANPKPQSACTAAEIEQHLNKGNDHLASNEDTAALSEYEKAFACKADSTLYPRLVLASCKAHEAKKAQLYYGKCGDACHNIVQRCLSFHITLK